MGILRDIFEEKVRIWEGIDEDAFEAFKEQLKAAGIKASAFKVNQRTLKCTGNCGSCPAMTSALEDEELGYKKLGRGCSDNLLKEPGEFDIYTIFVKKSEEFKALDLLGLERLPEEKRGFYES